MKGLGDRGYKKSLMTDSETHRTFLKNDTPPSLNYYEIFFTDEEKKYLSRWWNWMCNLVKGELPPINTQHERFVKLYEEKISKLTEPPKEFEKWYVELHIFQKTFVRYYFVQKHKEDIHRYLKSHGSDSIYYFSKVVSTFGDEKYIGWKFKGTYYEEVVKRKKK
jgi:uncharacterized protein YifE (UPF0438 family)